MDKNDNIKRTDDILSRINHELKAQHKTQAGLVSFLGVPAGTYTNWKLGRSRNFCEYIEVIADYLKVNVEWLVTGKMPNSIINRQEMELLELFRGLNTEKQKAILQNMKWLKD